MMTKLTRVKLFMWIALTAAGPASSSTFKIVSKPVGTFMMPFVQNADVEEKIFSNKASFAMIEKMAPLSAQMLTSITSENLRTLSMEEFNQIYARLKSGPIPQGDFEGAVLQKPPLYGALRKRLVKQLWGLGVFVKMAQRFCAEDFDDCLIGLIWKGKRFWPKNTLDQVMTKTVFKNPSGGLRSLIPDFIESKIPDETLFPMNTYCGISQIDTRRESIITDGGFGDDFGFPDYVALRDQVVTRKGLNITEEYRMLRPGLYIGKVFSNKIFLFNVALEKTGGGISSETQNACVQLIN